MRGVPRHYGCLSPCPRVPCWSPVGGGAGPPADRHLHADRADLQTCNQSINQLIEQLTQ